MAKVGGTQRVVAVDRDAARGAIRPGMGLGDARAIRPGLSVAQADPRGERRTLERIADWCGRFTPLVALDGPDGLVLDVGGSAHLFGGAAALREAVERSLAAQGFEGRASLAATPEAAWALARFGTVRIAPGPDTPAFRRLVAALPLAALRIGPDLVEALAQAGLRQVDDLLWRPRAPLAARFGDGLFARLDAVLGVLKLPVSPRFDPPAFAAEQRFASPITLRDDVERTLQDLSVHLCGLLERQNRGARRVEAHLFRVDGAVKRIAVGTSRPLDRPEAMARLFAEKIEGVGEAGLDTGYGFDVVRLSASRTDPMPVRQHALADGDWEGTDKTAEDLADLVDRLGARLGLGHVSRLVGEETHVPERAARSVPAVDAVRPGRADAAQGPPALPVERPIRLFDRPEPIRAVATVPDGPPMRFWWRKAAHDLAAVEGPERIAPEWWKAGEPGLTRDYFQVEDCDGHRYWLFREGLYGELVAAEPDDDELGPRWFLHGLFG